MAAKRTIVNPGDRFGRLVVVEESEPFVSGSQRQRAMKCECDCGNVGVYRLYALRNGNTTSCGCLARELAVERGHRLGKLYGGGTPKHGGCGTPEYSSWKSMISRCADKSNSRYGGRGIKVCDRWVESFVAFLDDMGRRPSAGHSIDRIDNDGDYDPGNCRWATAEEQCRNRSNTLYLSLNGETMSLPEWSERLGIDQSLIRSRLDRGWSDEEALTKPVEKKYRSDSFYRTPIKDRDAEWYREYERRGF